MENIFDTWENEVRRTAWRWNLSLLGHWTFRSGEASFDPSFALHLSPVDISDIARVLTDDQMPDPRFDSPDAQKLYQMIRQENRPLSPLEKELIAGVALAGSEGSRLVLAEDGGKIDPSPAPMWMPLVKLLRPAAAADPIDSLLTLDSGLREKTEQAIRHARLRLLGDWTFEGGYCLFAPAPDLKMSWNESMELTSAIEGHAARPYLFVFSSPTLENFYKNLPIGGLPEPDRALAKSAVEAVRYGEKLKVGRIGGIVAGLRIAK